MPSSPERGRPSKLTPELQQRICDLIKAGNTIEASASAVGVDRRNVQKWLARGRVALQGVHFEFARSVEEALGFAEVRLVGKISKASDSNWIPASWLLERRYPKTWGKRTYIQVDTQRVEEALRAIKPDLDPDAYEKFVAALASYDDDRDSNT